MASQWNDGIGETSARRKRIRLVRPYPSHTLEEALRVPEAIRESNVGSDIETGLLAMYLGTTAKSSGFIMRLNSSAKYGLTQGGHSDPRISLTDHGRAIVTPKTNEELRLNLVKSARRPEIFDQFYAMHGGKPLPDDRFAENLLQRELGVHQGLSAECLSIIRANGLYTGILTEVEGALHVVADPSSAEPESNGVADSEIPEAYHVSRRGSQCRHGAESDRASSRIFIGHDGGAEALEHVRRLLEEFGLTHVEAETSASGRPVSASTSEKMRECTAAILIAGNGGWQGMQYQIGAASVLYGDKLVVIKEDGSEHPTDDGLSLHGMVFDPENLDAFRLRLLLVLYRAGIVQVTL